jgi:aminoglycoside 6'-N-acetyltransferase
MLERSDLPRLGAWLRATHVAPWWPDPNDPESLEREYGPSIDGEDSAEVFIVESEVGPVGLIQRYRTADEPGWQRALNGTGAPLDSAGIDYLIGVPELVGHGLGTAMISQFVADTWTRYPEISAIVIAMQQANSASWRACEKAGFVRVWAGQMDSDDPSDAGPAYVYVLTREGRNRVPQP